MKLTALRIRHATPLAEQLETDAARDLIARGAKLYTNGRVTVLSARYIVDFHRISIHIKTPTAAVIHVEPEPCAA